MSKEARREAAKVDKEAKKEAAKVAKEAKKEEKLSLAREAEIQKIKKRDEKVQRQLEQLRKEDRKRLLESGVNNPPKKGKNDTNFRSSIFVKPNTFSSWPTVLCSWTTLQKAKERRCRRRGSKRCRTSAPSSICSTPFR
jgi:hypothetical protein